MYRSLKLFNELGIIKEISIDNKSLNLEYIKLNKKVEEDNNLEVNDIDIMLIGLCSKCKADNKGT